MTKWFLNSPEVTASKGKIGSSVMGLPATKRDRKHTISDIEAVGLGLFSPIVIKGMILLKDPWLN